jgi:periplasmic protein TonB
MAHAPGSNEAQVFLNSCLLDGDRDLEKRTRRIKRRAILISILLQLLFVAALILIPLLGKSENIASRVLFYPTVPYSRGGHAHRTSEQPHPTPSRNVCHFCQPTHIPAGIVIHEHAPASRSSSDAADDSDISRYTVGDNNGPGIDFVVSAHGPKPPDDSSQVTRPTTVRRSEGVQAAMLIHRVQPNYPILSVQTRREGRVQLHAIIAADGSIQSLEVISGDPFFIQSALAAVREWRYRPTILNGQPVEVETVITVVYTLSH